MVIEYTKYKHEPDRKLYEESQNFGGNREQLSFRWLVPEKYREEKNQAALQATINVIGMARTDTVIVAMLHSSQSLNLAASAIKELS